MLKSLIAMICVFAAALYVMTWDWLILVFLVLGLIALCGECLRTRLGTSARQINPEYDRKLKDRQFRIVHLLVALSCIVIASCSLIWAGRIWSVLLGVASIFYLLWFRHWEYRRIRRQNTQASS
jgi:hypothetical protein